MNIKNIAGGVALASTALFSSCENSSYHRAKEYMQDKPQSEFAEIAKGPYYVAQSKLDSVAFRDVMLNNNVSDSVVKEFNTLSVKNRAKDEYHVRDALASTPVKVKEFDNITNKAAYTWVEARGEEYLQFKTDSIAYRAFFEKHNLLNEKTLKHFNEVCKKIRPKI